MLLSNNERLLFWPIKDKIVINQAWVYSDGSKHNGVDIKCNCVALYPCEPGVVSRVQYWDGKTTSVKSMQSYGNMIEISHNDYKGKTLVTRYGHLSHIMVKPGDKVSYGTQIGITGATGNVTGPHLHLEVLYNNRRTNPMIWLGPDYTCTTAITKANIFKSHYGTNNGHSVRWIGQRAVFSKIPSTTAVRLYQAFGLFKYHYVSQYYDSYKQYQNIQFNLLSYENMDTIRDILWK